MGNWEFKSINARLRERNSMRLTMIYCRVVGDYIYICIVFLKHHNL